MVDRSKKTSGGIRLRLVLTLLLVCFIPVLLISVINFNSMIGDAKRTAGDENEKRSTVIKDDIMSLAVSNLNAAQTLASSPFTREFLKNPDLGMDEMAVNLTRVDEAFDDGNSTAVADRSGYQIVRSKGDCVQVADREYYIRAMQGEAVVSAVFTSRTAGTRAIVCAAPVYDTDGSTVLGVVQRNITVDYLSDYLANEVSDTQDALIADKDGNVIARSDGGVSVDGELSITGREYFTQSQSIDKGTLLVKEDGKKRILSYDKENETGWIVAASVDYASVMRESYVRAAVILIISLIIFALVFFIGVRLSGYFTEPIREISQKLTLLSNGEFAPVEKYTERNDELGAMAKSTNVLIEKLHGVINNIKAASGDMDRSANVLADSSRQMENSVDGVSRSVEDILKGTADTAKESRSENGSIRDMSESVEVLIDGAAELNELSEKMDIDSKRFADRLEEFAGASSELSVEIKSISDRIEETGQAVDRINRKVDAINDIAAQTNLLSLNAAIEAARAGEAGRGFAVVAEEVGKLAVQSSDSADEIRNEMKRLLEASNSAVEQSHSVMETVLKQSQDINMTVSELNELLSDIDENSDRIGAIGEQAEKCLKAKDELVNTMTELTDILEKNAESSIDTSSTVQEFNTAVGDLADSANDLKRSADDLKENIAFFK